MLHIRQHADVLRMLHWVVVRMSYFHVMRTLVGDVLRTLLEYLPWNKIKDHIGKSIGRLLRTFSGCPRDVILPSGKFCEEERL